MNRWIAVAALIYCGFSSAAGADEPIKFDPNYRIPSQTVTVKSGTVACPTDFIRSALEEFGSNIVAEVAIRAHFKHPDQFCFVFKGADTVRVPYLADGQLMATFSLNGSEYSIYVSDIEKR